MQRLFCDFHIPALIRHHTQAWLALGRRFLDAPADLGELLQTSLRRLPTKTDYVQLGRLGVGLLLFILLSEVQFYKENQ